MPCTRLREATRHKIAAKLLAHAYDAQEARLSAAECKLANEALIGNTVD
jgi:hypothetical protein